MGLDNMKFPTNSELKKDEEEESLNAVEQISNLEMEAENILRETEDLAEEFNKTLEDGLLDEINDGDDIEKQNELKGKLNNIAKKANSILVLILGTTAIAEISLALCSTNMRTAAIGGVIGMIAGAAGLIVNGVYTEKQEAAVIKGSEDVWRAIQQEERDKRKSNSDESNPSMHFLGGAGPMMK